MLSIFSGTKKGLSDFKTALPANELRKRIKIVVIDDEEDSFPYKLLQDDGYTIEWWDKVDSRGLQRLENGDFDLIILDIGGVAAPGLCLADGLSIIERVKDINPHQVIIAFSGQSFDLSKTRFWKLADDCLGKPATVIKCKTIIDKTIDEKITINNYWRAIQETLEKENVSASKIKKIEKEILNAIEDKRSPNIEIIKKRFLVGLDVSTKVVGLINSISKIGLS